MIGWTIFGIVMLGGLVYLVRRMRVLDRLPYLTGDKRDRAGSGSSESERSGIRDRRRL